MAASSRALRRKASSVSRKLRRRMALLALAFALAAGSTAGTDVDALQQVWSGIHDTSEQVVVSNDTGINSWPESSERRVRAVVAPVALPWPGSHVLYFEEFLH